MDFDFSTLLVLAALILFWYLVGYGLGKAAAGLGPKWRVWAAHQESRLDAAEAALRKAMEDLDSAWLKQGRHCRRPLSDDGRNALIFADANDSGARTGKTPKELAALARGEQLGKHHRRTNLSDAAAMWQTPQARDFRSGLIKPERAAQCLGSRPLNEQVLTVSRYLLRGPRTSRPGASFSDGTPRLNQRFVEHLMGMVPGWTASAPLETGWFQWWLDSHSLHLRELLSRGDPAILAAPAGWPRRA